MRKRGLICCLMPGLVCLLSIPSFAQMGKMKWRFKSRNDVGSALQQAQGNLRETYEAIVCAARQGYSSSALSFYEDVVLNHQFDATAKDSAAYVFAFDVNYSLRPWDWKKDRNPIHTRSGRAMAQLFWDRSNSLAKSSAEVSVMRVLPNLTIPRTERRQAYQDALRAIKLAPNWADAWYWLGQAAGSYALTFEDLPRTVANRATQVRLSRLELRAYDRAEKLNPSLKPYLGLARAAAYEMLADKKSPQMMTLYVNQYLRDFPSWIVWYGKRMGKTEEQVHDEWSRRIAKVQERAGA